MNRTRFEALHDKQRAIQKAEESGTLADSLDVRHGLLEKVRRKEITLEQAQRELKKIQRNAKREGKQTRLEVYRHG